MPECGEVSSSACSVAVTAATGSHTSEASLQPQGSPRLLGPEREGGSPASSSTLPRPRRLSTDSEVRHPPTETTSTGKNVVSPGTPTLEDRWQWYQDHPTGPPDLSRFGGQNLVAQTNTDPLQQRGSAEVHTEEQERVANEEKETEKLETDDGDAEFLDAMVKDMAEPVPAEHRTPTLAKEGDTGTHNKEVQETQAQTKKRLKRDAWYEKMYGTAGTHRREPESVGRGGGRGRGVGRGRGGSEREGGRGRATVQRARPRPTPREFGKVAFEPLVPFSPCSPVVDDFEDLPPVDAVLAPLSPLR